MWEAGLVTNTPAGWYDDPAAAGMLRYWDGVQWTAQAAPKPVAPPQPGQPPVVPTQQWTGQQPSSWGQGGSTPAGQWGAAQPWQYPAVALGPTTADGVPLASWWSRVGAYLIDDLIVSTVSVAAGWKFWADAYEYFLHVVRSAAVSGQQPNQAEMTAELVRVLWPAMVIITAVRLVYHVFFLVRFGRTPGKMATGIAVRMMGRPGPLTLLEALKRQALWVGIQLAGFVPIVSTVASLVSLANHLWPLWDARRQALHDKVAGTQVVQVRRPS